MAFYGPRLTPGFRSITTQKRTWPMSSHFLASRSSIPQSESQDRSVTHISIALRVQIRFSSSALNFIKTVRTSRQLPRTRPVDCGTYSQETVSDFSQDTRYFNNNNNNNHVQRILCFNQKNWHRCRKVIIWRTFYLAATKMVFLVVVFV